MTVVKPHPRARDHLKVELEKVMEIFGTGEPTASASSKVDSIWTGIMIGSFLRLHAAFSMCPSSREHNEFESETISHLVKATPEIVQKIVLINLAAEFLAGKRLRGKLYAMPI